MLKNKVSIGNTVLLRIFIVNWSPTEAKTNIPIPRDFLRLTYFLVTIPKVLNENLRLKDKIVLYASTRFQRFLLGLKEEKKVLFETAR